MRIAVDKLLTDSSKSRTTESKLASTLPINDGPFTKRRFT